MKKLFTITFSILISSSFAQWEWQNPLPHGNSMVDVTFVNENEGWAAGGSIIMHTVDGGNSWETQYQMNCSVHTCFVKSIYFIDNSNGWAVGGYAGIDPPPYGAKIWFTSDGGNTWVEQYDLNQHEFNDVFFTDQNNGWVVGTKYHYYNPISSIILHTSNGGDTWQVQLNNNYDGFSGIYFTDTDNGWAVGDSGTIVHTSNGGNTWVEQYSGQDDALSNVFFTDDNNGWVVGEGAILHTNDGGISWENQYDSTHWLNDVFFIDHLTGWVVGDGRMLSTVDGGENWELRAYDPWGETFYLDVFFVDHDNGWVIVAGECLPMNDYYVMHTIDGGESWVTILSCSTYQSFDDVYFIDPDIGWVVCNKGTILYTDNGGLTWEEQNSNTSNSLTGIHFISQNKGWIVGSNGIILHTANGGVSGIGNNTFATQNQSLEITTNPNPFTTSTTLEYKLNHPGTVWIEFYNQLGKLVDVMEQNQPAGKQQLVWEAEGLPPGVYFCRIIAGSETISTKIIKQH